MLIKNDFYRGQTEVRITELDKKAVPIEKEVKPLIYLKLKEQAALIEEKEILNGLLDDLIIISTALASSIKGIEEQGNLAQFLPDLIIEFNIAIYYP